MRTLASRFLALSAIVLILGSCMKEHSSVIKTPSYSDEVPVELTFSIPGGGATRAMSEAAESQIGTIDVLAFYSSGSEYRLGYYAKEKGREVIVELPSTDGRQLKITVEARAYTTQQVFVVLANASDELAAAFPTPPVGQKLEDIMAKIVSTKGAGEWLASTGDTGFPPIPMYAQTDPMLITADATSGTPPHTNPLIRMLARVDIALKSTIPATEFTLEEAMLYNHKTAGFVSYEFSDFHVSATTTGSRVFQAAVPPQPPYISNATGDPIIPNAVTYTSDKSTDARGKFVRTVYAFESPAYTQADRLKGTAIIVGGKYNGSSTTTYYRINLKIEGDMSSNASSDILRNHLYDVEIQSVDGPGAGNPDDAYRGTSDITVRIMCWNEQPIDAPIPGQYNLIVDKSEFAFAAEGGSGNSQTLNIYTDFKNLPDYPDGWTIEKDNAYSWLTLTPLTGPADATTPVAITVTPNTGTQARKATFEVVAGNLSKTITVIQFPAASTPDDTPPTGITPYVGAFWKDTQMGERLIRIYRPESSTAADGEWTALVLIGTDWIVLDKKPSSDNVWTASGPSMSGNTPGFETAHKVNSSLISVSGELSETEDIFFRIGLRTENPTPGTPRYGLVMLSYKGHSLTQRIWIRQGEDPDYLMRPQDSGAGGPWGTPNRPDAMKFSPYNLTLPAGTSWSAAGVQLNYQGGGFTQYPTQAGAYFQLANFGAGGNDRRRFAWNPYTTTALSPSWDNTNPNPVGSGGFWNDASNLYLTNETCPPGYRRPNNGSTNSLVPNDNAPVAGSEYRQSLWLNPPADLNTSRDNFTHGYYADGFFDRRTIEASATGQARTAVAVGNPDVAYIGGLFYNPTTNASLFFPTAGIRLETSSGALSSTGSILYYWSSSFSTAGADAPSSFAGWAFRHLSLIPSNVSMWASVGNTGAPVRCVVGEAPVMAPTLAVDKNTLEFEHDGAPQAVTVTTNQPGWTASSDQTWASVSPATGTDGQSFTVTCTENLAIVARTATITVTATGTSGLTRTVTVTQEGNMSLWSSNPWVGTFHRNSEKGERLIYGRNRGAWTATIVDGADWIRIDAGEGAGFEARLLDIFANGNVGDPETAPAVSGTSPVTGTGDILLRVGIDATRAAGTPPRYGRIRINWVDVSASGESFLYVRQGEDPDYLMRQADPITSGGYTSSDRPAAAKFSPYNLTAATLNAQTGINGAEPNPGIFTQYPTQGGAFWQWASPGTYARYAWTPQGTTIASWSYSVPPQPMANFWTSGTNPLNLTYETCPDGYRRPTDGSTNIGVPIYPESATPPNNNVINSEIRQSLYTAPTSGNTRVLGNSLWGYYADGYFDRREIVAAVNYNGETARSAVAMNTDDVAYIGRLYYNAGNNASLFFPAAGMRSATSGGLAFTGTHSTFWSSTFTDIGVSGSNAWAFHTDNGTSAVNPAAPYAYQATYIGLSMRCVVDDTPAPTLEVNKNTLTFEYNGTPQSIGVTTNQPQWTASSDQSWASLSRTSGTDGDWFNVICEPNLLPYSRTATITVTAGGLTRTVEVTQLASLWANFPWVGTFHRNSERGERLIYGGHSSVWTATIIDGGGWIRIDDGGAGIKARLTDMYDNGNVGNPESYTVTNTASSVSGMGDILFRVGLTGTQAAGSAPRYGRIKLEWRAANGDPTESIIYVRQGETDDYLMRPNDNGGGGESWGPVVPRPDARKYSPYNLTDPNHNSVMDYDAMTNASTGLIGVKNGRFTDYPTQTGYLFQWGKSTRAFNAYNPAAVSNYNSSGSTSFWNVATMETCPVGYHRPNDGPTGAFSTGNVAGSEFRQSLFLNPPTGTTLNIFNTDAGVNFIGGYYADGFFDRRRPVSGNPAFTQKTAVSTHNHEIAYMGILFFNPNNNASLFFPLTGQRASASPDGAMINTEAGYYMTTSQQMNNNFAWTLVLVKSPINPTSYFAIAQAGTAGTNASAHAIRCVADLTEG